MYNGDAWYSMQTFMNTTSKKATTRTLFAVKIKMILVS